MSGNPLVDIGNLLIGTLASLYLAAIMLRFLFQLVRADFYNPISQAIVKATNPLLMPLRKLIPGVFGFDIASIVLAILFHAIVIVALGLINNVQIFNPLLLLSWAIIGTLSLLANIYFWGMLIVIVISWVAPQTVNPAYLLLRQIIEPIMSPFRRLLPDMGGIDLSPILAFLSIKVVQIILSAAAVFAGLSPAYFPLVLGI